MRLRIGTDESLMIPIFEPLWKTQIIKGGKKIPLREDKEKSMWVVKYCGSWNYKPQATSLSASINSLFPDTCAIEEGEKGQFELFQSGKSFMSAGHGKFFDLEDVKKKLTESGQDLFTNR